MIQPPFLDAHCSILQHKDTTTKRLHFTRGILATWAKHQKRKHDNQQVNWNQICFLLCFIDVWYTLQGQIHFRSVPLFLTLPFSGASGPRWFVGPWQSSILLVLFSIQLGWKISSGFRPCSTFCRNDNFQWWIDYPPAKEQIQLYINVNQIWSR
jgi:hypothetical protein